MGKILPSFRCPNCNHGFVRGMQNLLGMTSCPNCHARFNKKSAHTQGVESSVVWHEVYARKKTKSARIMADVSLADVTGVIRGSQVPMSVSEARFKARAIAKGWKPHRPSWPDFLVETKNGFMAVEVKARNDEVSATQRATFGLLEAFGIPVFLWKDARGAKDRLVRWKNRANRK